MSSTLTVDSEGMWVSPVTHDFSDCDTSLASQPALSDLSPSRGSRRSCKPAAPSVSSQARRSPRLSNNGFKPVAVTQEAARRQSHVKKAKLPEVMQMAEMQRIGVEECHIDPEELSEAKLLKSLVS